MPSQPGSRQSHFLSNRRSPAVKARKYLDQLGTVLLVLSLAANGVIFVFWLAKTVVSR